MLFFMLLLSPVFIFIIHAIVIRVLSNKPLQLTAIISGLLGNIPVVLTCFSYINRETHFAFLEIVTVFVYGLIVYNLIAYIYFHLFNMSETARRIRILTSLYKTGKINKDSLINEYSPEDMVDSRLRRLVDLGQLTVLDGYYGINKRLMLTTAKIYKIWLTLLG